MSIFSSLSDNTQQWIIFCWMVVGIAFAAATCNIYTPPDPPDPPPAVYDCSTLPKEQLFQYMEECRKTFPEDSGWDREAKIKCIDGYPKKMCKHVDKTAKPASK